MAHWIFLVLLMLTPFGLVAQCPQIGLPTVPRIQGKVVDADGKPQKGVVIEAYLLQPDGTPGKLFAATKTDKKGRFKIRKRKETDFLLRLRAGDKVYKMVRVRIGSLLLERSEGFDSLLVTIGVHPDCPDVIVEP